MWDVKEGMKVVFIHEWDTKSRLAAHKQNVTLPETNRTYTVRAIAKGEERSVLINLEEIPNQMFFFQRSQRHNYIAWPKEWFRPFTKVDKGMEILRWARDNPNAAIKTREQPKRKVKAK